MPTPKIDKVTSVTYYSNDNKRLTSAIVTVKQAKGFVLEFMDVALDLKETEEKTREWAQGWLSRIHERNAKARAERTVPTHYGGATVPSSRQTFSGALAPPPASLPNN